MSIPVPPVDFPGMTALLDGSLWQRWREKHPDLFPLQDPTRQIRVLEAGRDQWVFQVRPLEQPGEAAVCVLLHREAARAAQFFESAAARMGGTTGLLQHPAAVGMVFPHDPSLLSLTMLANAGAAQLVYENVLGRRSGGPVHPRVVRWHPGRHAIVHIPVPGTDVPQIAFEAFPLDRIDAVLDSQEKVQQLADSGAPFRIPRTYVSTESRHLLIREWLPGPTWVQQAQGGQLDQEPLELTGRALAVLHESPLEMHHHSSPPEHAADLLEMSEVLSRVLPSHTDRIRTLAETVAEDFCQLNLSTSSVVLGRLRACDIVTSFGRPVWLSALDAARGPAALDLGSLAHDLEHLGAAQAFEGILAGYRKHGATVPSPDWLDGVRAYHRFRDLSRPLRTLAPDWPARMAAQIEDLEATLREART